MTKLTKDRLEKISHTISELNGDTPTTKTQQLLLLHQLVIAEEQSKSADKLERFTFWLIVLTVVLIIISVLALIPPLAEMFNHVQK